jgi:hypothetical protein
VVPASVLAAAAVATARDRSIGKGNGRPASGGCVAGIGSGGVAGIGGVSGAVEIPGGGVKENCKIRKN